MKRQPFDHAEFERLLREYVRRNFSAWERRDFCDIRITIATRSYEEGDICEYEHQSKVVISGRPARKGKRP